jgi:hypothetical protein
MESYDSWVDPEGPVRTVCRVPQNVVVAPASLCCHMMMMLLSQPHVDDVVVLALC